MTKLYKRVCACVRAQQRGYVQKNLEKQFKTRYWQVKAMGEVEMDAIHVCPCSFEFQPMNIDDKWVLHIGDTLISGPHSSTRRNGGKKKEVLNETKVKEKKRKNESVSPLVIKRRKMDDGPKLTPRNSQLWKLDEQIQETKKEIAEELRMQLLENKLQELERRLDRR